VARAASSIAYQIRDALDALRVDSGVSLRMLYADGGPTANALLMQFAADLTGAEIRVASMAEGSALGAALAGLLGLGIYSSMGELAAHRHGRTIYVPTAGFPPNRASLCWLAASGATELFQPAPSSPSVTP